MKSFGSIITEWQANVYAWLIKRLYKVKQNRIVFQGKPDFSDNPRALSDYLLANGYDNKYEIFWLVNNRFGIPSGYDKIIFIHLRNKHKFFNWETLKIMLTAKYVFSSHGFAIPKEKGLDGQKYITLWHGCGYKDNAGEQIERFFDLALVPGPLFVKTKCRFWHTTENYLVAKGYPRYDWLLNPSEKALKFSERFHHKAKKVVIWMPTYRNSKVYRGYAEDIIKQFPLMASDKDWKYLDSLCVENSILLLVKLHPSQKAYEIGFDKLNYITEITNKDFDDAGVQMYEFLALTDGLISDYSSVAIDYLLVNKPIAFALDDFEIYQKVRGFVFENPQKYMPGHHLHSFEDLCGFILDIAHSKDEYNNERKQLRGLAICKSSCYCEDIVKHLKIE